MGRKYVGCANTHQKENNMTKITIQDREALNAES